MSIYMNLYPHFFKWLKHLKILFHLMVIEPCFLPNFPWLITRGLVSQGRSRGGALERQLHGRQWNPVRRAAAEAHDGEVPNKISMESHEM